MKKILLACSLAVSLYANLHSDKEVVHKQLKNGLSYYIQDNALPEGMVEFRFIVNIGSLEESEKQKGVAHLLEHMAFNGTKNFQKNELMAYFESIGCEFGTHVNASTGMERTVYKLSVPYTNEKVLEKTLSVLRDWADGIDITKEELDKERGVIIEEARSTKGLGQRLFLQEKEHYFKDSRYKDRLPIGDMEIIKNIQVSEVQEFYETWYRPEFMSLVVVGDVKNIANMEQKIQNAFASLKSKSQKKRYARSIPSKKHTRVVHLHDKELTTSSAAIHLFEPFKKLLKEEDYKIKLSKSIAFRMFNTRLYELSQESSSPFLVASGGSMRISDNKVMHSFNMRAKAERMQGAFESFYEELQRISQQGFVLSELERAKKEFYKHFEQRLTYTQNAASGFYAKKIQKAITSGNVLLSEEDYSSLNKNLLNEVSLEDVNKAFVELVNLQNRLVFFKTPLTQKKVFNENEILALFKRVETKTLVQKGVEKEPKLLLAEEEHLKGAITHYSYLEDVGLHQYNLSNGARVLFKQTPYQKGKVQFQALSKGGSATLDAKVFKTSLLTTNIVEQSGLNGLSQKDLRKLSAGKDVEVHSFIEAEYEGFSGYFATQDYDFFLQKLHLFFKKYQVDESVLERKKEALLEQLRQKDKLPQAQFSQEFREFLFQGNERKRPFKETEVNAIAKEDVLKIYQDRFKDPNNFTYVFVGDISKKHFEQGIMKYIASLEKVERTEQFVSSEPAFVKGKHDFVRYYNSEDKAEVTLVFEADSRYSDQEAFRADALGKLLSMKLHENIREEKSGVYTIDVNTRVEKRKNDRFVCTINFSCSPKRVKELIRDVEYVIKDLQDNGIEKRYIDNLQKQRVIAHKQMLQNNHLWMGAIIDKLKHGEKLSCINDYLTYVDKLNAQEMQVLAKNYFSQKNYIKAVLMPKDMAK